VIGMTSPSWVSVKHFVQRNVAIITLMLKYHAFVREEL
jgi:hypothetical protein